MSYNPTAHEVVKWTDYFDKLPKGLADAINLFEQIKRVEVEHSAPALDVKDLTVGNVEDRILELAQQLVEIEQVSARARAKDQVLGIATNNLLNEAKAAIPALLNKLGTLLKKQAQEYVDAVAELPDADLVVTPQELFVASDVDALDGDGLGHIVTYRNAYQKATSAASGLDHLAHWVATTRHLSEHPAKVDSVLLLLKPVDADELATLDAARSDKDINPALKALNPVFFAAAKNGIEFGANTPDECHELRIELTTKKPVATLH